MSPVSLKHNPVTRFLFKSIRSIYKSFSTTKYVKAEYRYVTGHKLNLNNPTRYTEKLQWYRLCYCPNTPLVIKCADKYELKEYLKCAGFHENIVQNYGVYDSFDEIDFDALPSSFVIKCTHGCHYNILVKDKNTFDKNKARKLITKWLKIDYGKLSAEPHYSQIKPRIIIEEFLSNNKPIVEYKIHVFNGKAKYMYIVTNRENDIHYNNYYIDWTPFPEAQFNHWTETKEDIKKPSNWDEMVKISETLGKPFPFVRVDLYNIDGHIYVSELTFTPAKGTLLFKEDKVDYQIGEWLTIPN